MTPIDWTRMSDGQFEDMVSCLLSHENPLVQRIDGKGGDGGRDCQFEDADGLRVYQMKHFPGGRVRKTQRRQVERSLVTASKLNPVEWWLITPVDHNKWEKDWFDTLKAKYPFPLVWRGRTWLDGMFAERQFIYDYYVRTTADEVVKILREVAHESAALAGGIPDAIERTETLVRRANTLDPHYRFEIASDGRSSRVTIQPAYAGAELDRPITIQSQFRFDTKTEEGRAKLEAFEKALDFGIPVELSGEFVPTVELDAPAGLGGTFERPSIEIGPGQPAITEPITLVFNVSDPLGAVLAELSVTGQATSTGRRGTVLHGQDRGGYLRAVVVIDVGDGRYRINFHVQWKRFIPQDFLPVARFLAAYHTPNAVSIARDDGTMQGTPELGPAEPLLGREICEFVENLALVQMSTGLLREVAGAIEPEDFYAAAAGRALLTGQSVRMPWTSLTMTLAPDASLETRTRLVREVVRFETTERAPVPLEICGTTYRVGTAHRIAVTARVDPTRSGAPDSEPFDATTPVVLMPETNDPLALVTLVQGSG